MKNALNSVKVASPATNAFDLSHQVISSFNMGDLVPVLAMEVIPGDRVRVGCENLSRLAPTLAPMMADVDVYVEYFFSPDRLIWEEAEVYYTNGGSDAVQVDPLPAHPFLNYTNDGNAGVYVSYADHPLLDHMGIPDPLQCPDPDFPEKISALPFGHYQKICQDFYRDENLQEMKFPGPAGQSGYTVDSGDNTLVTELTLMRKRCWEADYFTKALPFAQKGEPVEIPGGLVAVNPASTGTGVIRTAATHALSGPTTDGLAIAPAGGGMLDDSLAAGGVAAIYDPNGSLITSATLVNDWRTAIRLQEWLELNARGGTRYSEMIRAHFNVQPDDARLQRPEYIVGVKTRLQISEVLQTSEAGTTPQGTMAGHGVGYTRGNYGKYFVKEHGYIIGLMSIKPKTVYQQGIPRHFLKYTHPTEKAWPKFAQLGEQSIENREVMAHRGAHPVTGSLGTFGYTPRYMEYKALPNRVAGQFKTTLDFWHMGRIFDPLVPPVLDDAFVTCDPTYRVFAVEDPTEDHLWCWLQHNIHAVRALPFYGTPTF